MATLSNFWQHTLVKKTKHLPGLKDLDKVLLIFAILVSVSSLEDEPDDIVDWVFKVRQVVTLYMLHYVIHYEKVYQLTIRVLQRQTRQLELSFNA